LRSNRQPSPMRGGRSRRSVSLLPPKRGSLLREVIKRLLGQSGEKEGRKSNLPEAEGSNASWWCGKKKEKKGERREQERQKLGFQLFINCVETRRRGKPAEGGKGGEKGRRLNQKIKRK